MSTLLVRVPIRRIALLLVLSSLPAAAQPNRVFVSALTGNDANSCVNINTPCQTFQGAVNQVAAGGSIIVLTTGGYGAVTIGKALTIEAPTGVIAFIHPASGNAITVNAGASDVVVLRGLSLNVGVGDGIAFSAGAVLQVEHCVLNGFNNAITHQGSGLLIVKDTTIRTSIVGISMGTGSASSTSRATIERTRVKSGQYGLLAGSGASITIRASNISGNLQEGLVVDSHQGGATSELNVEDCVVAHNGTGIESLAYSGGTANVRVSNSTVAYNNIGLRQNGGSLFSRTNNTAEGNTTDTLGTITSYSAK